MIADLLPFETTQGLLSLGEIRAQGEIRYAPTADQFRQIAGVAAAQGLCVVNGGYVNDTDLLERVADIYPDVTVQAVDTSDDAQGLEELTSAERDDHRNSDSYGNDYPNTKFYSRTTGRHRGVIGFGSVSTASDSAAAGNDAGYGCYNACRD